MSDNILLAYGNKATGATLAGGTWDSTLALNNLKTGELAEVARSSNTSVYNTQFRFDLGANYVLRALALVNHNLTTGALWRARTTDATLDMDFTGPTSMRQRTLTTSGGANGTRVNIYGAIEAATCPRYDFSPVNLASGTATQTISNVPAGTYVLIPTGSGAAVMASGSTVSNTGTIGTTTYPAFVVVNSTGNVTLTVLSAATAIHFRKSLGLLVEEGRTNLLIRSSEFDNAAWNRSAETGGGISANSVTSPAGSMTADAYTWPTATSAFAFLPQSLTGDASQALTFSVYAKIPSGTKNLVLSISDVSLKTEKSPVQTITTEWQRIQFDVPAGALSNTGDIGVGFLGMAAGDVLHLWGAQLEAGSFATSHIPTTSAAVTRTADSVSITGSNFSDFYNQSEGTFYVDFDSVATDAADNYVFHVSNAGGTEEIRLLVFDGALYFQVIAGGVSQVGINAGTIVPGQSHRAAVTYKANDFAVSLDGAAPVTDASGTVPAPDRLGIGRNQVVAFELNGHNCRIAYWPTRRTNAELQSITTTGPDALGLDTGWQPAKQMTFHGDTPTDWGAQYPLIAAFDAQTVRYGTIEIDDTANPDGYVELGQLFVAGGFQPEHNAEYQGFGDGRTDLSSSVKSVGGQKYSTARRRPRTVDFNFPVLSPDEGDHLDEMMAEVGTTEDVLYVPDPADPAKSQRYGFLGTLRELTPLEYPFFDHRAMPLRLEQKL